MTMRSKDQLAVIAFLDANKTATPLQLDRNLGWSNKHTHAILGRLVRIGIIKNIGKARHPEYRLLQRWQAKVKPPKPPKASPDAKPVANVCMVKTQQEPPSVATVCRQNWQGYQIHKIFGSARS
ncbi:hypothetical protein [Enterobacter sp.]|uniref:hypothetical protein n=1 Tax=Enterobacter sp. TaxID=42895 RepID=UPI00296E926A|nr:hypothetical protein [Enterobacter sp.]